MTIMKKKVYKKKLTLKIEDIKPILVDHNNRSIVTSTIHEN